MNIKLYTSKNCPVCEMVKAKLKEGGFEYATKSADEDFEDMTTELAVRGVDSRQVKSAPVMVIDGCGLVWSGRDVILAIQEKEWRA